MKVLLKYKQRESKPSIFVERFGMKLLENQSGFIDYEQEEEINELEVNKRIKELKSFSNRNYHTFIVKTLA